MSEQKLLSHSGEPCPDVWHGRWEQSRVRFGRAVCSGVPPVSGCRQSRWQGFFCVPLFVSPHTSKKPVCVQKAFSSLWKSLLQWKIFKWGAAKQDVCVCDSDRATSQPERGCWLRFHRAVWLATAAQLLYAGSGSSCKNSSPFPTVLPTPVTCTVEALRAVLIIEAKDHYWQAANRTPHVLGIAHPVSLLQLHQLPEDQRSITYLPWFCSKYSKAVPVFFCFLTQALHAWYPSASTRKRRIISSATVLFFQSSGEL